jgi:predicted nucleic acid-binding protein
VSRLSAIAHKRALLDTSAFVALIVAREQDHAAARRTQARLIAERWRLVTTNFIVAEAHALMLTREGRAPAARALRAIAHGTATIVRVNEDDERRAREIIHRYADKHFSLTDALSFAVMERLRIGHAFTFDRHFAQHGFATLGPAADG